MGEDITGSLERPDMYAARGWCVPPPLRSGHLPRGDWTTQHANFFRSIEITKHILFIMLSAVVAVAAFNIVSTMVMVVKSKRRDIAILRTFGASPAASCRLRGAGQPHRTLGIASGRARVLVAVNLQTLVHGLEASSDSSSWMPGLFHERPAGARAGVRRRKNMRHRLRSGVRVDTLPRMARRAPAARRIIAQ